MSEDTEPEAKKSGFGRMADAVYTELSKVRTLNGRTPLADDQTDVGRTALRAQRPAPWIVMVKAAGTIAEPEQDSRTAKGGQTYSVLYRADQIVEAHIIGTDDDETELLWCDFLLALRNVMQTFARPGNFAWVSQEEGGSGHSHGGREKVVQLFTLMMDVPGNLEELTIIDSEQLTPTIEANC